MSETLKIFLGDVLSVGFDPIEFYVAIEASESGDISAARLKRISELEAKNILEAQRLAGNRYPAVT